MCLVKEAAQDPVAACDVRKQYVEAREVRWITLLSPFVAPEALPGPVPEPTTINREGVTVDVAAQIRGGEEGDSLRYVLGPGEPAHRGASLYVGVGVSAPGLVFYIHLGLRLPNPLG
jgi:hypothetical protein